MVQPDIPALTEAVSRTLWPDLPLLLGQLQRIGDGLERFAALEQLAQLTVPVESRVFLELDQTPSVAAGNYHDFDIEMRTLSEEPIGPFAGLVITQVEIDALDLATTDTVTLDIYRSAARRFPQDLVARFDGTSSLSDGWKASFSGRAIEYDDLNHQSKIHGRITNASGNSATAMFHAVITGRRVL